MRPWPSRAGRTLTTFKGGPGGRIHCTPAELAARWEARFAGAMHPGGPACTWGLGKATQRGEPSRMFWLRGQLLSSCWLVQSSCLATGPGRGVRIHMSFSSQDMATKTSKASVCRYVYISWSRFCPRGPAVLPDKQLGFVSTPGLVCTGNPRRHTRVDAAAWSGPPLPHCITMIGGPGRDPGRQPSSLGPGLHWTLHLAARGGHIWGSTRPRRDLAERQGKNQGAMGGGGERAHDGWTDKVTLGEVGQLCEPRPGCQAGHPAQVVAG